MSALESGIHVSPQTAAERAAARIDEVSTIPQAMMRVIQVAESESAGAAELRHALESDASLSARVLRYVNSSATGLRSRVTNLQTAITFLGFRQIRNLAVTACVSDVFTSDDKIGAYSRARLWRHLVAVGIGARMVARAKGMHDHEDAFLAGLLHDLGIILLDQHMHERFRRVIGELNPAHTLMEIERRHFGFDHTALGLEVARRWQFPRAVQDAIRYHHSSSAFRGADVDIVRCVETANIMCSTKGITSVGMNLVKPSRTAFELLRLGRRFDQLAADLDAELERHADLFVL